MKYLILLCFLHQITLCHSQAEKTRAEKWLEDITVMHTEMPRIHADLFHDLSKSEFNRMIAELKKNVNRWNDYKIVTEISRIVGKLNDGHSGIIRDSGDSTKAYSFHYFPVRAYMFDDGVYIMNTTLNYKDLVGKKLVAIENTSIDKVITMLRPLIPKDNNNEYSIKDGLSFFLSTAEHLHALNIISNPSEATYIVEDVKGKQQKVKVAAVAFRSFIQTYFLPQDATTPLFRRDPMKFYWDEYIQPEKLLYIKYTLQSNDSREKLAEFANRLQKLVDTAAIEKTIVDLRDGQGGNIGTMRPLLNLLITNKKINKKGKLLVLINRRTQSAGTVFANWLEFLISATFFGEPTLSSPNMYSDGRILTLPNSKIKINLSTIFLRESLKQDKRISIEPDVRVLYTSKDFFSKRDPVMEKALAYVPPIENKTAALITEKAFGKYYYSPIKTLTLEKDLNGFPAIHINGVNGHFLQSRLYKGLGGKWNTDIRNLSVKYDEKNNKLELLFANTSEKINKKPANWQPLAERLQSKNFDSFMAGLREIQINDELDKKELERYINSLGYVWLNNGETDNAIRLFEINTTLFSSSSNTYDSLAEAFAKKGNKEKAINNYKKALELNPQNLNAKKMLESIEK